MAKPLNERIASAKGGRMTTGDLETVIAEAIAERERLAGSASHYAAESVNFALSDDDRDEAARFAERYTRTAVALDNEITELQAMLQRRHESENAAAAKAVTDAIVARRDEIAARFADRVPALIDELTGLLAEVVASDEEMARAKLYLPSAEAVARGVPGNFYNGPQPLGRFTQIKIPGWNTGQNAWPKAEPHIMALSIETMERARERLRAEEKRENARWSRYHVQAPSNGVRTMIETRKGWLPMDRNSLAAWMTAEGVKDAEANGCTVTPLEPDQTVGLPDAMMAL